jgi:acetolactate synthase-1/2/3 large subunit
MKVAHLIAKFLAENGVRRVYTVSGGGDLHMIHAICDRDDIRIICPQNEQGAAYAADAEARLVGIGCAMATSGPGATNMITGIATSYYDSIPVLYITGNQTRERLGIGFGVRQFGFQSMPFVECVQGITKYATIVMRGERILYELEKCLWYSKEGRKGPVVIDVPDDIQRMDVDIDSLEHYQEPITEDLRKALLEAPLEWYYPTANNRTPEVWNGYERPLIALGAGIHLAGAEAEALAMLDRCQVPCVTTWGAADVVAGHPLFVGTWGTHGVRAANFAVQNADLIIAIGTRLDTKATGSPASSFAPKAQLVMVDIDANELAKMERIGRTCATVQADAKEYIKNLYFDHTYTEWIARINGWKAAYPAVLPEYPPESPYRLMEQLGTYLTKDDVVVSDTGCPLAWAMQVVPFKGRFIHAFNQTPMGYGLPAAIGAAGAHPGRVVLLVGDGGLSETINELATVRKHNLNIKMILFNNRGHAMCRQTQKQWLQGVYHATSDKDLATPNFSAVAHAYGIGVVTTLDELMHSEGPCFLELHIDPEQGVIPQARFGKSIEDADPALPREELARIMA